jgi:hypothetical protein
MKPSTDVPAPQPWARASVTGVLIVAMALFAHTSADGDLPPVWLITAASVVATLLARAVSGRELRLPALLAALAGGQFGLHAVFLLQATGRGQRVGLAGWLCCGGASAPTGRRLPIEAVGSSPAGLSQAELVLLVAHLTAAGMSAVWLRRAERQVWSAARSGAHGLRRALTVVIESLLATWRPPTEGVGSTPRRPDSFGHLAPVHVVAALTRRGPPAALLA